MAAPVRFRVKGTKLYIKPGASSPYETTGRGRRSTSMYAPSYGPNAALAYAGPQLRAQSREADRKNGYARAMANRLTANLVGTGIVPQIPSQRGRELWKTWIDQASADGTLDFYGLQGQVVRGMVVGGEVFCRLRGRQPGDGLAVPLQIQVLEAEYVPQDKTEPLPGGRSIEQGIERNAIGRRDAYWMYKQHPDDQAASLNFDPTPMRVRATEVLHVYDALLRPGQLRGEPWLTRALAKLRDLDAYDDAELVRKKTSALLVGFVKRTAPASASLEDLQEQWGEDAEIDGGVGGIRLEPGSLHYLDVGEEVEFSQPQDVGGQYETFMRQQFRALAVAADLLYEQLTGDYGNLNDRTWRAAFNEFKRRCEMLQHHIVVYQFCAPVYLRWATLARSLDLLTEAEAPNTVPWVPQAFPYINPKQDVEAAQLEIRAGIGSRQQKAAERGLDAADIDRQQAEDNKRADELGVKYDSDGRNSAKPGAVADKGDAADGSETDETNGKGEKQK